MNLKEVFTLRYVIILLLSIIIGMILIAGSIYFEKNAWSWTIFFGTIGATILISGFSTLIIDLVSKRAFLNIIQNSSEKLYSLINISTSVQQLGMEEIYLESGKYNYKNLLENHKNVIISINDGRTWISNNREYLRHRFLNENNETTFIFLDPEGTFLESQAKKARESKEELKNKLAQSLKMLSEFTTEKTKIKILHQNHYNPHSIFLCEEFLVLTPYYTSSGRREVPLFVYKNIDEECYYKRIKDDLELLISLESKEAKLPAKYNSDNS